MNNIYVSELPQNCYECEFCDNHKGYCDLQEVRVLRFFQKRDIGCPLKLLSDALAEERMIVCNEIKSKIFAEVKLNNKILIADDIWKIVDECQIERGE